MQERSSFPNRVGEIKSFAALVQFTYSCLCSHQELVWGVKWADYDSWLCMGHLPSLWNPHFKLTTAKGLFGGFIDTLWYRRRNYKMRLSREAKKISVPLQERCSLWQVNWSFIRNYSLHCHNKLTTLDPTRYFTGHGKCCWCTILSIHSNYCKIFWNKWRHEQRCASAGSLGILLKCDVKRFTDLKLITHYPPLAMSNETWNHSYDGILQCCIWKKKIQWIVFHTHGSLHIINELWCFPLVTLPMHNHDKGLLPFPLAQRWWQSWFLLSKTVQDYTVYVFKWLFHSIPIKAQRGLKVSHQIKWNHVCYS